MKSLIISNATEYKCQLLTDIFPSDHFKPTSSKRNHIKRIIELKQPLSTVYFNDLISTMYLSIQLFLQQVIYHLLLIF